MGKNHWGCRLQQANTGTATRWSSLGYFERSFISEHLSSFQIPEGGGGQRKRERKKRHIKKFV